MLFPIKQNEIDKLIPSVATGKQFNAALGNPQKIFQRLMISSIGGVITLLISQSQITSQFYSLWLVLGVVFLLYILWGPILEASRKNYKFKSFSFSALVDGYISDVYVEDRVENQQEQANKDGRLEVLEKKRAWVVLDIDDEDGFIGNISFPLQNKFNILTKGMRINCVVFSNRRDFDRIQSISDAWCPEINLWIGSYPFLLRPAFEEFVNMKVLN
ncbi:hypothetical protein [Prochlorococcus marinus]|uniref:hypothetical protein n=1 Tax=Prochlorococcus marinus TaxID=1219 RepID=UPI0022B44CDF|nr:hypothetical protein [Prochlorococcus marinus]